MVELTFCEPRFLSLLVMSFSRRRESMDHAKVDACLRRHDKCGQANAGATGAFVLGVLRYNVAMCLFVNNPPFTKFLLLHASFWASALSTRSGVMGNS